MRELDVRLFYWVNQWPDRFEPLFKLLSDGIKTPPIRIAFAVVFVLLLLAGKTTRRAAIMAIVAFPIANEFSESFKLAFRMLRPCVDLESVLLRTDALTSFGTASSHAANMSAVAFVMCATMRWWGLPWVLLALLTGLSRIYVGVHYPSQVLLGWVCGTFSGFLVVHMGKAIAQRVDARRVTPSDGPEPNQA